MHVPEESGRPMLLPALAETLLVLAEALLALLEALLPLRKEWLR